MPLINLTKEEINTILDKLDGLDEVCECNNTK